MSATDTSRLLFDFSRPEEIGRWQSVNDLVMGGRSESRVEATGEGAMAFTGRVSFENGGGFASIRSAADDFATADTTGLQLTLRGDGQRYKVSVRCDRNFDGATYQAPLPTTGSTQQQIRIPWSALRPSYHGRLLNDQPALDPAHIQRFGLLIADRQEGPFRLEIFRIETYQETS
jgi:NADH dehydrogenase [ubiquinone] 1 alpha subcomplex assembly factor 1